MQHSQLSQRGEMSSSKGKEMMASMLSSLDKISVVILHLIVYP
jgi:hypothetical protein